MRVGVVTIGVAFHCVSLVSGSVGARVLCSFLVFSSHSRRSIGVELLLAAALTTTGAVTQVVAVVQFRLHSAVAVGRRALVSGGSCFNCRSSSLVSTVWPAVFHFG